MSETLFVSWGGRFDLGCPGQHVFSPQVGPDSPQVAPGSPQVKPGHPRSDDLPCGNSGGNSPESWSRSVTMGGVLEVFEVFEVGPAEWLCAGLGRPAWCAGAGGPWSAGSGRLGGGVFEVRGSDEVARSAARQPAGRVGPPSYSQSQTPRSPGSGKKARRDHACQGQDRDA